MCAVPSGSGATRRSHAARPVPTTRGGLARSRTRSRTWSRQLETVGAAAATGGTRRGSWPTAARARVAACQGDRVAPAHGRRVLPGLGRAPVRRRSLDPRDGRSGRRHQPAEREGRAIQGGHLARDPRREPRGHRVHAVRLLPGRGRGGGRRRCSRTRSSPIRRRRATATCSRWTPRRSSRDPARGSSTAWRSSPGPCILRHIRSLPAGSITRLG